MAIMIPSTGPRDFEPASRENLIYDALRTLPDDYYVIHSMGMLLTGGEMKEREADFVVFNPRLGLLCVEAKAGAVHCSDGAWYYGSGREMPYGGPYRQADTAKWAIRQLFDERKASQLKDRCKFLHAVWLVSLKRSDFAGVSLPPEASLDITLFMDDLVDPEPRIRQIMSMPIANRETDLTPAEGREVVTKVLCPAFSIAPTSRLGYDLTDVVFARLLDSQTRVLNFIRDQRFAVINGAAGTGKTLIAMERARQAARQGRVLFLCYNSMLRDDLAKKLSDESNIEVRTIASFACKMCGTPEPDYYDLADRLLECVDGEGFPYRHVVIDEGQDFGVEDIERSGILELLLELVSARKGTFYLFYDRRQFVQGSAMPEFINDADCKLTLYVNCRNTKKIALCSVRGLGDDEAEDVLDGVAASAPPQLYASSDPALQEAYVDSQIADLKSHGLRDVVVLTCKTEARSALRDCVRHVGQGMEWKRSGVRFATCRTFKGLEADAVILVDVDGDAWREPRYEYDPPPGLLFYTGASRAKHELRVVCDMDEDGCRRLLGRLGVGAGRKPVSRLAKHLACVNTSGFTISH